MEVENKNWVYLKWKDHKNGVRLKDIEASICNDILQKFTFTIPDEMRVTFSDIMQIENLHSVLDELLRFIKDGKVIDSATYVKQREQRKLRPEIERPDDENGMRF